MAQHDAENCHWRNSEKTIVDRLESIERKLDRLRTSDLPNLMVDIAELKTQARIWGGFWGVIGGAAVALIVRLMSGKM